MAVGSKAWFELLTSIPIQKRKINTCHNRWAIKITDVIRHANEVNGHRAHDVIVKKAVFIR